MSKRAGTYRAPDGLDIAADLAAFAEAAAYLTPEAAPAWSA